MTSRATEALLGLVGLGIAIYLTIVHYLPGQVPLICSSTGTIDCSRVTTSVASTLGPLPVALLGVAWFVIALLLLAVASRTPSDALAPARLIWAAGGLVVVFYLIYAELFVVGAICLWCTAVHLLVIALFLLTLYDETGKESRIQNPESRMGNQ